VVATTVSPQPAIKNEELGLGSELTWNSILNWSSNLSSDDPEVVILKRFEEPCSSRRSSLPISALCQGKGDSPTESSDFSDTAVPQIAQVDWLMDPHELVTRDLEYHRRYIAPRIIKMHDKGLLPKASIPVDTLELDPFESESIQFPPVSFVCFCPSKTRSNAAIVHHSSFMPLWHSPP